MLASNSINQDKSSPRGLAGRKPVAKRLIKLAISLACLAIVYRSVNFRILLKSLSRVSVTSFVFMCFLYLLGQLVSAAKWRRFLSEAGVPRSFPQAAQAYFSGMFVNTFGFGTVGGDLTRALAVRPTRGQRAGALASVVADRVHGLGVLFALGAISVILFRPLVLEPYGIPLSLAGTLALGAVFWFGPRLVKTIFPSNHKLGATAESVAAAFPHRAQPFWFVTAFSAMFHISQVVLLFIISRELGVSQLPLTYLFATVPFVNIAAALPISMNGVGVREALFVFFFTPTGVPYESTVAMGAVWIMTTTAVSAFGGFALSQVVAPEMESETEPTASSITPGLPPTEDPRIRSAG